jgi:methylaspartate ammonia-lyase
MHTQDHVIHAHQVDNLLLQLHHLLDVHRTELGEQALEHELEWLSEWISHFRSNEHRPEEHIDEHAYALLESIYQKLALATNEEQRMQAESPLNSEQADRHIAAMRDTRNEVGHLLHILGDDTDSTLKSVRNT